MHHIQRFSRILSVAVLLLISTTTASAAELSGIVLDQAGEPASGVIVKLITTEMWAIRPVPLDEATTDDAGTFKVTVPDRWLGYPQTYRQELTVLAGSLDRGFGGVVISRQPPLPTDPLSISLATWSLREVTLVDSDGNPASNVALELNALLLPMIMPAQFEALGQTRFIAMLPEADRQPAVRTNDDGTAELLLPVAASIGSLQADLGNGVTVNWSIYSDTQPATAGWPERIQLPQMMEIPLQVAAEPATALNDLSIIASVTASVVTRQSSLPMTTIQHDLEVDMRTGSATVTAFDDTHLYFRGGSEDYPDWRLDPLYIETSRIEADGIKLNFKEGIKVTGTVIDGTGERLTGVSLFVMQGFGSESLRTDDKGEFEILAAPGQQLLVLISEPGYRGPAPGPETQITIPADAGTFNIPEMTATRLLTITGTVRNADGTVAADTSVRIVSEDPDGLTPADRLTQAQIARTDEDGVFRLNDVGLTAKIRVAAWNETAASESLAEIPADLLTEPVEISISPASLIEARGRVVDPSGNGIAGMPVLVRHRVERPTTETDRPVGDDIAQLVTDRDGRFTLTGLRPWGEYIAVVGDSTPREVHSGWAIAETGDELRFSHIETSLDTIIRGRVVSTSGDPIPSATLRLLSSTTQSQSISNADGSFAVESVGGVGPLLIASAEGFSFNGVDVQSASEDISIVLRRPGEPDPGSTSEADSTPPVMTIEERRDLAVKLFEMLPRSDPQTRTRALSAVASIDSEYALERLNELPANNQAAMGIRQSVAMTIAPERPADAIELLEELPDTGMKLYMLAMVEPRADLDDDERRELLARIVQDGRGVGSADHRVMSMGIVGERLLDLGERDAGEALLREGHTLAENMSPAAFSGYVRGAFAEELVQIDVDGALALIEPLTDVDEFNRHLMNMAHELAPIDPDRAAELLDLMRETPTAYIIDSRDGAVQRVCYRMVRVAPELAIELADSIEDDVMRVYCLGLMADSLLDQDEVSADSLMLAARLVNDAWGILTVYAETHDQAEIGYLFPSTMGALLLPATAELFPGDLSSRVWQTIALRRPMARSGSYVYSGNNCAGELALLLSEVAPVQAQSVAAWVPDAESGETQFRDFVQYCRAAAEMITATSPDQIESAIATLSDPALRNRLLHSFIAALSRSGESRQRAIRHDLSLWFPDDEDMGPQE